MKVRRFMLPSRVSLASRVTVYHIGPWRHKATLRAGAFWLHPARDDAPPQQRGCPFESEKRSGVPRQGGRYTGAVHEHLLGRLEPRGVQEARAASTSAQSIISLCGGRCARTSLNAVWGA